MCFEEHDFRVAQSGDSGCILVWLCGAADATQGSRGQSPGHFDALFEEPVPRCGDEGSFLALQFYVFFVLPEGCLHDRGQDPFPGPDRHGAGDCALARSPRVFRATHFRF